MKIKRSHFLVFFFVLAMHPPITKAKSCLWRIRSENGIHYLQGSIHALKAEHYPLPSAIEEAYGASSKLVLEMDMSEMHGLAIQQLIHSKAQLPEGRTLESTLNPEVYANLSAEMERIGMSIASFQKLEPWFVVTTVTLAKMHSLGFQAQHGLDQYFFSKAQQEAKPIEGLEHARFQVELLASLADRNPNEFVARALTELQLLEQDFKKIVQAWSNGDIDVLGTLINSSFSDYPELFNTFILERNRQWMNTLNPLLKKPETCLIVVGAGHLPGKGGLLELLKQSGFTLEQL